MDDFTLLTPEVRQFIITRDWPKGLKYAITEKHDPAPHLFLVFYRDNWLTLTYPQQAQATTIVKEIMSRLWPQTPIYVGKMKNEYEEE